MAGVTTLYGLDPATVSEVQPGFPKTCEVLRSPTRECGDVAAYWIAAICPDGHLREGFQCVDDAAYPHTCRTCYEAGARVLLDVLVRERV